MLLSKKPKPQLQKLLDEFRGETAIGKVMMIGRIREYIRRQDPYIVKDEIRNVTNEQDLNVLQGVGMRGFLWYEVQKQKARCIGL